MTEIWALEYRTRERKNGKWSAWLPSENISNLVVTAFSKYPDHMVFAHEKYERRAVRFIREETPDGK